MEEELLKKLLAEEGLLPEDASTPPAGGDEDWDQIFSELGIGGSDDDGFKFVPKENLPAREPAPNG